LSFGHLVLVEVDNVFYFFPYISISKGFSSFDEDSENWKLRWHQTVAPPSVF